MTELSSEVIQKYKKVKTKNLKKRAQDTFNAWIRERDKGQGCIDCGAHHKQMQAGHFYSAGKYNHMRFLEDNCHLQSMNCNYFKSGNLLEYRKRLIKKIGQERVEILDRLSEDKGGRPDDRMKFILVIEHYKFPKMKVISNGLTKKKPVVIERKVTCYKCKSKLSYDNKDLQLGLNVKFIDCPVCHTEIIIEKLRVEKIK